MRFPSRGSAFCRHASAMQAPSLTAAASSKLRAAGLCASAPLSRTQTYSAFALFPRRPNTSSPTANWLTAPPTATTSPASSMPGVRYFGRRSPVKKREKNGSAARKPQSVRLTVVARTLTRTSSSFGFGRSISSTRRTSGGPYRSNTTAFIDSLPLVAAWRAVDRAALAPGPSRAVKLGWSPARGTRPRPAPGRNHPAVLGEDAAPEVRRVELDAPDRLVDCSQLGHREGRSHEGRRHARCLELHTHPLDRVSHDSLMVERQLELSVEHVGHGREAGVRGVGSRNDVADVTQHRQVGHCDDVHSRVAARIAVRAELRQH